jgi:hypothetical protein
MNGRAGVFTHPYFAITDADGNFSIKDAPAGNYRIMVYNGSYLGGAKGARGRPITIPAGAAINLGDLEFSPPPPSK